MSLQGVVVEYQYAETVKKALDFLITSKKSFGFIIRALRTRIFKRQDYSHQRPIPDPIRQKVEALGNMLDEPSFLIPMEPGKKRDAYYRLSVLNQRSKFKTLIRKMTHDKIHELRFMSYRDRNKLVAEHKQKATINKKLLEEAKVKAPRYTVESETYVLERAHWRANMLFPEGENVIGLTEDEFCNLAVLVDLEKLPWGHAQLLMTDLPLAKWLASPAITRLIQEDFLNYRNSEHLILMFEPEDDELQTQRKNLSLLSSFILTKRMTLTEALSWEIFENDIETLTSPDFIKRVLENKLLPSDTEFLSTIGIEKKTRAAAKL